MSRRRKRHIINENLFVVTVKPRDQLRRGTAVLNVKLRATKNVIRTDGTNRNASKSNSDKASSDETTTDEAITGFGIYATYGKSATVVE